MPTSILKITKILFDKPQTIDILHLVMTNELRNSSKLTAEEFSKASPETQRVLKKIPVAYPNTDRGFGKAEEDFAFLMDYALGTDEGRVINNALDWKRWELSEYYEKKYGWSII
jgi:hypothetical protein